MLDVPELFNQKKKLHRAKNVNLKVTYIYLYIYTAGGNEYHKSNYLYMLELSIWKEKRKNYKFLEKSTFHTTH